MSKMSCTAVTIKYLLFIFNLLFVISGIIILSVGFTTKAYYNSYETFLEQQYFSAPNLLIAIGFIIFIIAFFGCCGAVKQNYCMIITFSTLLILIFVLQFAAGISGFVLKNQTEDYLEKTLYDNLKAYNQTDNSEVTAIWDQIQENFECCGVNSSQDWISNSTIKDIPISCCKIPHGVVVYRCNQTSADIYKVGCETAFGNFIKEHAVTIGGVGLGFAAVQILAIMFACYLAKQVRQHYEYM